MAFASVEQRSRVRQYMAITGILPLLGVELERASVLCRKLACHYGRLGVPGRQPLRGLFSVTMKKSRRINARKVVSLAKRTFWRTPPVLEMTRDSSVAAAEHG